MHCSRRHLTERRTLIAQRPHQSSINARNGPQQRSQRSQADPQSRARLVGGLAIDCFLDTRKRWKADAAICGPLMCLHQAQVACGKIFCASRACEASLLSLVLSAAPLTQEAVVALSSFLRPQAPPSALSSVRVAIADFVPHPHLRLPVPL